MGAESIDFLGRDWSLRGFSGVLLYLLRCRGRDSRARRRSTSSCRWAARPGGTRSIGGITATVLWEITRHVLVWYFGTLSQVAVVYGSLTTAIVVLLSLEIAATLLLLGAQVIAEYERIGTKAPERAPQPLRT